MNTRNTWLAWEKFWVKHNAKKKFLFGRLFTMYLQARRTTWFLWIYFSYGWRRDHGVLQSCSRIHKQAELLRSFCYFKLQSHHPSRWKRSRAQRFQSLFYRRIYMWPNAATSNCYPLLGKFFFNELTILFAHVLIIYYILPYHFRE